MGPLDRSAGPETPIIVHSIMYYWRIGKGKGSEKDNQVGRKRQIEGKKEKGISRRRKEGEEEEER